jgi:hypothetical protein
MLITCGHQFVLEFIPDYPQLLHAQPRGFLPAYVKIISLIDNAI